MASFAVVFKQFREDVDAYARERIQDVRARLDDRATRPVTLALLATAACVALAGLSLLIFMVSLPNVSNIRAMPFAEATIAYSADGQELARYHIENRTWVGLDQMAPSLIEALIATEDRRFFDHSGVDLARVFGAIAGTAGGRPFWGGGASGSPGRDLGAAHGGRPRAIAVHPWKSIFGEVPETPRFVSPECASR